MFGNRYGELGLFIFPMSIISILTTMTITIYYISKAISENLNTLKLYSLIGFDIANNLSFKWYMLALTLYENISEGILLFAIFFILTTIFIVLIANKKISSMDKSISTFISYVFFLIFYAMFFTFWWGISIIYATTHKTVSWR